MAPLAVPASLLALIPTGPTLDRADALSYLETGSGSAAPGGPTPAATASGTAAND